MQQNELMEKWIHLHNKHYINYCYEFKEPRYNTKQFFLYSYKLLHRMNSDNRWTDYLDKYSDIFRRDPANDYYGYRDPTDQNPDNARKNSIEWINIFEINNLIGFPYNESAKEKMLKNSKKFLLQSLKSLPDYHTDIMICSAIEFMPNYFGDLRNIFFDWLEIYISENEFTPHQMIAYLNALKGSDNYKSLRNKIIRKLLYWIKNPEDTARRQILIWARLVTRLEWCPEIFDQEIQRLLRTNFFECFNQMPKPPQSDWQNIPILLEALYCLSTPDMKKRINDIISSEVTPPIYFKLRDIFNFLDEGAELIELQNEIAVIKEKCRQAPSKDLCQTCMESPQGKCWIRILSKTTGVAPWSHGGFEVADVVVYTLNQGIYFVIKSNNITSQRGEGDVLYRQCTQLFNSDHALILYWNPLDTHPSVIDNIRKIASSMNTNPRFEVVDKKYMRQIYKYYVNKFENVSH